jgi:hypothetical protein
LSSYSDGLRKHKNVISDNDTLIDLSRPQHEKHPAAYYLYK